LREPCCDVIRNVATEVRGALPVQNVAPVAGCGFELVIVAHVAGNAGRRWGKVRPRQGKPGYAVIGERRRVPAQRGVAIGTVPRQES
jgi:hypothetical protein